MQLTRENERETPISLCLFSAVIDGSKNMKCQVKQNNQRKWGWGWRQQILEFKSQRNERGRKEADCVFFLSFSLSRFRSHSTSFPGFDVSVSNGSRTNDPERNNLLLKISLPLSLLLSSWSEISFGWGQWREMDERVKKEVDESEWNSRSKRWAIRLKWLSSAPYFHFVLFHFVWFLCLPFLSVLLFLLWMMSLVPLTASFLPSSSGYTFQRLEREREQEKGKRRPCHSTRMNPFMTFIPNPQSFSGCRCRRQTRFTIRDDVLGEEASRMRIEMQFNGDDQIRDTGNANTGQQMDRTWTKKESWFYSNGIQRDWLIKQMCHHFLLGIKHSWRKSIFYS